MNLQKEIVKGIDEAYDEWSREMVDKVFNAILDEMSNIEAEDLKKEVRTYEEKIRYFIIQEERFENYFL